MQYRPMPGKSSHHLPVIKSLPIHLEQSIRYATYVVFGKVFSMLTCSELTRARGSEATG